MISWIRNILHQSFCLFFLLLCCLLVGCHTIHATHPTAGEAIQSTMTDSIRNNQRLQARTERPWMNNAVKNTLLPPLSHYVNPVQNEEPRFDVVANKVPAREFFLGLVSGTTKNMVIDPKAEGFISLNLKNVTLKQALDATRDVYGYDYRKTSYGYEISSPSLQTQLFHLNYLDVQRSGKSYIQVTTGQVSSVGTITSGSTSSNTTTPNSNSGTSSTSAISSIETKSETAFWKDIDKALQNMIGSSDGRGITVNALTGVISVRAFPSELRQIARFIESLQTSLNRQVILEAKILEIKLDDEFQSGVDWSLLANPTALDANGNPLNNAGIGQTGNQVFAGTDLSALTGIFALRVNGNFKTLIQLLQTQGNVQVLSSPHISTVNNQKAVIKVGQDEFFVTGVSTTNTIVGTNTLPSQSVSLTPFFSGITLDVTPEISSDNTVVLHIHPSVSNVKEQTKTIGLGVGTSGAANNLVLPLAASTIRESDNIVRAKNGQVVVIGGLMQNAMNETIAETPVLGKIPFLGAAFRRTQQISTKSELVILLRPIVATNREFTKSMEEESKSFQILKRPFHTGGLPKVFGNEAETCDNE